MPIGAADDVRLGERRVEHAVVAEQPLQAVRHLEHAALARTRPPAPPSGSRRPRPRRRRRCAASRAISSFSVRLMAATIVSGLPSGCGRASRTRPTSDRRPASRRTASPVSFGGLRRRRARRAAASLTSRSTSAAIAARSSSVASRSLAGSRAKRAIGSRRASASRSAGVLYSFSSSDSECEYGRMTLRVHERRALARADVRDRLAHRAEAGEEVGAVDRVDVQAGERCAPAARCRRPAVCTSTGTEIA